MRQKRLALLTAWGILPGMLGCMALAEFFISPGPLSPTEARELITNEMRALCPMLDEVELGERLYQWQYSASGALSKPQLYEERMGVCENGAESLDGTVCSQGTEDVGECLVECILCDLAIIDSTYPASHRENVRNACYYLTETDADTLIAFYQDYVNTGVLKDVAIARASDSCRDEPGDTGEYSICAACRISVIDYVYP